MMYYWLATRNVAASLPKWRSLALLLRSPTARKFSSFRPPPPPPRHQVEQIYCLNGQKNLKRTTRTTKKFKALNNVLDDKDLSHIMWWKERLQQCRKPSTIQLVKRLIYTNLLGLDVNLKNGSLKEGNLNWEILQFKSQFPREILLCRVGDFYEAIGIDACFLVEYAGLNPFGGQRVDSIPRAGCPVVNLRQTLDDLTRHGYSVCIVEEVQGPTHARSRKGRFISGHAHPGSPYVFGLAGIDHDLDFPEPMPVVGISHSARGYCMISVLETMKTYSLEDGLTEEALVTKIRTCQYHYLFLHSSLRNNSSETCRWGEFGEGGLLWGECVARHFEWFEGNPITELLFKVTELYGLGNQIEFRNATVPSENRPRPLYLGTATQIGCIPTEGIPCLLKVLLPASCTGLPVLYVRDLLLNPPAYEITSAIQETCKLMSNVMCSIPAFTCVSSAKLVKLLELREVNHIEFCRIKNVLDEILQMYRNSELNEILKSLMEPTWVATGLKIDFETLISECEWVSGKISEMIAVEGESEQKPSTYSVIPNEFFEDMESSWKGRVKRVHIEDEFEEVERAAQALALTVTEDFLPIITRIKATTAPLGGPKGEILYAREHEAIWFKGKRFVPAVWAGTPGEEQIKQLRPAVDSKGKKVGEEWFTTVKVEDALMRYHDAGEKAKAKVLELLKGLSAELQTKMNVLVFASMLLVIAKALFAHVSEGRRRKWVFPSLMGFDNHKIANICTLHDLMIYVLKHPWAYIIRSLDRRYAYPWTEGCFLASNCHWKAYLVHEINKIYSADTGLSGGANRMHIVGLSPYWLDPAEGSAVQNTVNMQSLFLLTGPNGGGKSSLLRSICAAALLGICGFMVPAESAVIPHFDSIMLHMKSYDSPADGKSSFQVEMSEIRSLITGASSRSLVLVDEICRGTETAKGTCIAGSIVETLDKIGCLGIVSTHLHGIFDLPLDTKNTECKAMGTEYVDGQTKPTWRLRDGTCRESLAFETAKKEGIPEAIIQRAEDLYFSAYNKGEFSQKDGTSAEEFRYGGIVNKSNEAHFVLDRARAESFHHSVHSMKIRKVTEKDVESVITLLCQRKLIELYKLKNVSELVIVQCVAIGVREQPPPSTIGSSCVYVMLRPDKKLYVGVTDDIDGRVRAHRAKEGMATASFLYFIVPGKSIACQLETLLVNQLPHRGFPLTNMADGKHRNFGATNLSLESVTVH